MRPISPYLKDFFLRLVLQNGWYTQLKKVCVGLVVLGVASTILYFGGQKVGLFRSMAELPEVQEALKKLDEEIPKEARSLENLIPMAQMAYDAIEKYAKLNQD